MENQHIHIVPPEEENRDSTADENKKPGTGMKIIVLASLIVLLVIGILLPIKLVPNFYSSISTVFPALFSGPEKTVLSSDRNDISAGEEFVLNWTGGARKNGSYVLSYNCLPGVNLETSINRPGETISCNTPYYFTSDSNTVTLTPLSTINRYTDVPISLGFLAQGSQNQEYLGNISITVTNPNIATASTTATSTVSNETTQATSTPNVQTPATTTVAVRPPQVSQPTVQPARRVSNPLGKADLSVQITATGILNTSSAGLVPATIISQGQRGALRFIVTNNGDKNTGVWSFTATLPSNTNPTYTAYNLPNLGPGDSVIYTLGFENIGTTASNSATISVDPSNQIVESRENNNTANVTYSIIRTVGTKSYPTTAGRADLSVRVIGTGIVDRGTDQFFQANYVNVGDRAAVQFEVKNNGGQNSGTWQFTANLPTADSQNSFYTSDTESSLQPGQTTIYTIGFDRIQNQGGNTVTINIDPQSRVDDSNRGNNAISATIYRY